MLRSTCLAAALISACNLMSTTTFGQSSSGTHHGPGCGFDGQLRRGGFSDADEAGRAGGPHVLCYSDR